MAPVTEKMIDGMRARELRNLLVQGFGVQVEDVAKIIDREELRELALRLQREGQWQQYTELLWKHGPIILLCLLGIGTVLFFREAIEEAAVAVGRYVTALLLPDRYRVSQKWRLVDHSWRRARVTAVAALLLSLQLEFASTYIQICTMLGWILPRDSPLRHFLLPTLSVPVNTGVLLRGISQQVGSSSSISGANFNLDVGPMLTVMLIGWIVRRLDEFAAAQSIDEVRERNERREKRAFKRFKRSFDFSDASAAADDADAADADGDDIVGGHAHRSADAGADAGGAERPALTLDNFIRRPADRSGAVSF